MYHNKLRQLLIFAFLVFISTPAFAIEVVTDFETESVPIVNEILRANDIAVRDNTTDIATNVTAVATNTTAVSALGTSPEGNYADVATRLANYREVVTGNYAAGAGDDTVTIGFSDATIVPVFILVGPNANGGCVWWTGQSLSHQLGNAEQNVASIDSVSADEFICGDNAACGADGVTYYYIAMG